MEANPEPENKVGQFRDYGKISNKKSSQNKLFWVAGIIALALMIGLFFFFSKKSPSKTTSSSSEKTATSSSKQKSGFCESGQEFKSTKQGYDVCFPIGWISNRDLSVSDLLVGFDPSKSDSTNPGLISVLVSDKSEDQSVQDISSSSTKFEYSKFAVDGFKGTQIVYTKGVTETVNSQAIDTVVVNLKRTYTISLNSNKENYDQNKSFYDKFIASWKFIKETESPPWSNSGNILVKTPWIGDTIKNPVEISGDAVAFEGTVNIRIKDSKGHTLVETTVQAQSGVERSKFSAPVSFAQPSIKTGTVEVYTLSAKDGSEQDKVSVPVVFP